MFGQPAIMLAFVSAADGSTPMTGYASFLDGNTYLGTVPVLAGQAQFPIALLTPGQHAIRAVYSDAIDLNYYGSFSADFPVFSIFAG
jgi:hypothetical protein